MFLSERLEEIISGSGCFDADTCIDLFRAIGDKVEEEMKSFDDIAKKKGCIKSSVIYAAIDRHGNTFMLFCKKHPDVPQEFVDYVENYLQRCRDLVDNVVEKRNNV